MKKLLLIFLIPFVIKAQLLTLFSDNEVITYADTARSFNYYVDNTGTGDTLSTIAEVNALSLQGLDTVFFKRGCEWREQERLKIQYNGEAGYPIVYSTYGVGEKPVFNGASLVTNWVLSDTSKYGNDLLNGWTLLSNWTTTGAPITINDANTFTSTSNGGVLRFILTIGQVYKYDYSISSTASAYGVYNASGLASNPITSGIPFTAVSEYIYIRNTGAGVTDINSQSLYQRTVDGDSVKWVTPALAHNSEDANYTVVIIDDTLFSPVDSLKNLDANLEYFVEDSTGTAGDSIYVYSITNPALRTSEISSRLWGVLDSTGHQYITIKNLELRNYGYAGIDFRNGNNADGHVIIDSCDFYRNRVMGMQFYNDFDGGVISDCISEYNGNGFYANVADSMTFTNCTFSNNISYTVSQGLFTDGHGVGMYKANNIIVQNSTGSDNGGSTLAIDGGSTVGNNILRYNKLYNQNSYDALITIHTLAPTSNTYAYYNLLVNDSTNNSYAIGGSSTNGTVYFYNNTVYQNNTGATAQRAVEFPTSTNYVFKNNIVYKGQTVAGDDIFRSNTAGLPTSDYNIWYDVGSTVFRTNAVGVQTGLSNWQTASSQDANSFDADPTFTTNGSDFTLQSGSPAINNGATLSIPAVDILGNPIVGNPDIGAYEKQ